MDHRASVVDLESVDPESVDPVLTVVLDSAVLVLVDPLSVDLDSEDLD